MTDIQQWRRKIQTARARTPAIDVDDSDGVATPTTPKRSLKPKPSSCFTHKPEPASMAENSGELNARLHCWMESEPYPDPAATDMVDGVMCRLMAEPYESLGPHFNGKLLQIFECFRGVSDEKDQLQARLIEELERHQETLQRLSGAQKQWLVERQEYKAEIKRLELLLAQGKRGLAEVTIARQSSLLSHGQQRSETNDDHNGIEKILQFLERMKRSEEKAWSGQRATFRKRQASPSAQMRRLSKNLASEKSMTNIQSDLPVGNPPHAMPSKLLEASFLEDNGARIGAFKHHGAGLHGASEPKTSLSDDANSAFSCVGHLLPDEAANVDHDEAELTDGDFIAIQRISSVLARRCKVDAALIIPKLLDMFNSQLCDTEANATTTAPPTLHVPSVASRPDLVRKTAPVIGVQKQPSLMSKASGFFHKLRPQVRLENPHTTARRFSFEAGDDAMPFVAGPRTAHIPSVEREPLLRKSVSMFSIRDSVARTLSVRPSLSPVAQSPTASAPPSEPSRISRIPTPIRRVGSLARLRQDREDSSTSLLTAYKLSVRNSRASSPNSAHSRSPAGRSLLTHKHRSPRGHTSPGSGNTLLDQTNVSRSNTLV